MDPVHIIKTYKKLSITIGIIVFILLVLPLGIRYAAVNWLEDNHAKDVSIDDVDINLFFGTVGIEGFSIGSDKEGKVQVKEVRLNMSMLNLFIGRFFVESLTIDGLDCVAVHTPEELSIGIPIPLSTESTKSPETKETAEEKPLPAVGIGNLSFKNSKVRYHSPMVSIESDITSLTHSNLVSWKNNSSADLLLNGAVNGTPLNLDVTLSLFSEPREVTANIVLEGLSLKPFKTFASPYVSDVDGSLHINTQLKITIDKSNALKITQTGEVLVTDIKGTVDIGSDKKLKVDDLDLSWKGSITAGLLKNGSLSGVNVDGEFMNTHLLATLSDPEVRIAHDGVKWQGTIQSNTPDILSSLEIGGNVGLKQMSINSDPLGLEIISIQDIAIASIVSISIDDIDIDSLLIEKLSLALPHDDRHENIPEQLLKHDAIQVKAIKIKDRSNLQIDEIMLKGMDVSVYRDKTGDLPLIKLLTQISPSSAETLPSPSIPEATAPDLASADNAESNDHSDTEGPETPEKFLIKINTLYFSDTNSIHVIDESVTPTFDNQIVIEALKLENIDNSSVDNAVNLLLNAKIDKHSLITVTGQAKPFGPEIGVDVDGKIKNIDLTKLSPYSSTYLGYNIKTGVLSADVECNIDSGLLNVNDKIIMNNIKLIPDDQGKVDQLTKQFTMPLDYALSIIRDKNNDVILEIPVSGDVENPDFNFNDIIKIAMKKALKKGSMKILKNLLQPYGTMITAAELAVEGGKYITKIRLDPVAFPSGSAEDITAANDYLLKIKSILDEKTSMRLTICGKSVPEDLPEMSVEENREDFLAIAKQRSQIIQDFFVSQGISVDRLFLCNPEIDLEEGAAARAELSL